MESRAMKTHLSILLPAPRRVLFAFLADPRNRPRWQSSIVSLEMTSDGAPRVGTTWTEHARGFGRFEMEITECVEGTRWAERGRSRTGAIELALTLDDGAEPGTTRVDLALVLRLSGPLQVLSWLAPPVLRPLMKSDLRRAARLASALAGGTRARTSQPS
jgi:uncharacterized protein YndB with AHSA1/START domain